MSLYLENVIEATNRKNSNEPEFLQAVEEVLATIKPVRSEEHTSELQSRE